MLNRTLSALFLTALLFGFAFAHETQTVGEGEEAANVIVGMVREPAFTDERNGLDLIIRDANDEPIENLENSLEAEITAPSGGEPRVLELRAQYGQPGYYTDDFVLSEPGVYTIRIGGFIGEREIDLTFESHEVGALDDLRFP